MYVQIYLGNTGYYFINVVDRPFRKKVVLYKRWYCKVSHSVGSLYRDTGTLLLPIRDRGHYK